MRFHENSETKQVGVAAPGVGTTKVNREEAVLEDFCYQFLPSWSRARRSEGEDIFFLCTSVLAHVQIDTDNT